ncbi:MAG: glycine--tRNA ligase [Bacteroidia bacterium]
MSEEVFKKVVSHAKEYGFVFPSSEIYDGLGAVYDYGQNGAELKNNLRTYWWKAMVQMHENIVGIDAAIFMHPKVWKASGHIDGFSDPMIDNKDSKKRYRADQLIENQIQELINKGYKEYFDKTGIYATTEVYEITQGKSRFSSLSELTADLEEKSSYFHKANNLQLKLDQALLNSNLADLKQIIIDEGIKCEISKTSNWTDVRQFNLMFATEMGAMAEDADKVYLRPETAQGIFVNFLNVQKTGRMKIPFGIAQTGKAFRNEIIARQFIMRMREFEQMEMQFFIRPGTQKQWYEYWKEARIQWHNKLGFGKEKYRFHDHVKLAHYADAAVDIEFDFPFGFKEMEGIHSRTDFDLRNHQKLSGKKMQYFDAELDENGKPYGNYVPYVIETSIGLDRLFLATLCACYKEEEVGEEDKKDTRVVLTLPSLLAPYKVAIFPLTKKDGLPEKARVIMDELKLEYNCFYEEKDAIGKRYRRQDALGTPFCITVDHDTLNDDTVTIRYRDTMQQERIPVTKIKEILREELDWKKLLG